jgi:hypothetical protein
MRILRKYEGFTTNSSASSEWYVPETDPALNQDSDTSSNTDTITTDLTPVESTTLQKDQPHTPPGLPVWGKTLMSIGLLGFLVVGFFIAERFIRKLLKKLKAKRSED